MAKTNDEWELSKENIQPLQQGRTHGVLQVALSTHPEDTKILHQQQAFEQELRTYSGNDPLSLWCNYIKWVEQNFPKGGRDGHIGKLIQRCLVILKEDEQYYDDKRFIQIWLKYASMTVKPIDIYEYMYSHNIGCKAAVLYTNWSWEVEQLGNVKKANKILLEGIKRKVEPFDQLKAYYNEFESRVVKKVMTNPDNAEEPNDDCRSAFSVLKSGKKETAPIVRIGENVVESFKPLTIGGQQPLPKRNDSLAKVPFKIYNAENIQPSPLPIQSENATPFVLYSDQYKENEKKASKWNKVRVKQVIACPSISSVTPDFKLHCDEGPQPASTPRSVPKVFNVLQPRKDCDSPPMALFEPPDPRKIPMYDRRKVYGGGEEFSLEEIRAAAWHKKQKEQEIERKLAEQEKLLKEREELIKNLKKQVDQLTNDKKINTPSVSLKENSSQSLSPSRDSCVSDLMDLSDHSAVKGTIRKELFPELKTTSSYREPTNMLLQELYNGTLCKYPETLSLKQELFPSNPVHPEVESLTPSRNGEKNELFSFFKDSTEIRQNSVEEPSAFSVVKSSATSYSKPSNLEKEVPFSVFSDPTENHEPISVKDDAFPSSFELGNEENIENNEDLENIPPAEYIQDMTKRELSGILEPSKNVFFIPLEEQENEEEEDFNSDEEIIHRENQPIQDVTIPPCNTEIFFAADICASTPCTQQRNVKRCAQKSAHIQNPVSGPYAAAVETPSVENVSATTQEAISRNESIYKQSTYPYTNLSVILESSREGYKSTSSSGSSAGATQLSHFYSHDRTKLLPKMETFKEPLPPAQVEKDIPLLTIPEKVFDLTHSVSDPFDNIFREQILQSLYKSSDFNGIIRISNKPAMNLKIKNEIIVGGEAYTVIKLIAEHHNGKVYKAIRSNTSTVKVALKFGRQNRWEFHVCNTLHQRLQDLGPPDVGLSVVKPIAGERFSDSFIFVHEFCELGTLYDLVNLVQKNSLEISELLTMCVTLELLLIVSKLHECEILHCDITPFNVLVQENIFNTDILTSYPRKTAILKLIDFSQAIDLKLFEKGTCFQTPQYDYCIEMREGKPWVHQLDWYGVLNCVHLLLFSDFMKVKKNPCGSWGIERRFKYQDLDIWPPLFDELLNLSCYQQLDIEKHVQKLESNIKQSISLLKKEIKYWQSIM